jgi:hypothetical protein
MIGEALTLTTAGLALGWALWPRKRIHIVNERNSPMGTTCLIGGPAFKLTLLVTGESGRPMPLKVPPLPSWSSLASAVCTAVGQPDGTCLVTPVGVGTCQIMCSWAGGRGGKVLVAPPYTVTVDDVAQSIAVVDPAADMQINVGTSAPGQ